MSSLKSVIKDDIRYHINKGSFENLLVAKELLDILPTLDNLLWRLNMHDNDEVRMTAKISNYPEKYDPLEDIRQASKYYASRVVELNKIESILKESRNYLGKEDYELLVAITTREINRLR